MLNCHLIPYRLAVFVKGANEDVLLQPQYMCKKTICLKVSICLTYELSALKRSSIRGAQTKTFVFSRGLHTRTFGFTPVRK